MNARQFASGAVLVLIGTLPSVVDGNPPSIEINDSVRYGVPPIDYYSDRTTDVVDRLAKRVETGEVDLKREAGTGYLRSVLRLLEIDPSSQVLVFSKTGATRRFVGPTSPRAVYFGDEAYVAWLPGTDELELAADDPEKGAIFYTLSQGETPRFERDNGCLGCHATRGTLGVPGPFVESSRVDAQGWPLEGAKRTSPVTHETPFASRFGGWFVTGKLGRTKHGGNAHSEGEIVPRIDLSKYASTGSDVVAQLVLHHQLHGRNLITRVGFEHRTGVRSDAEDRLLRYLFLVDEPDFESPFRGGVAYRRWFESRGERGSPDRVLRTLNLESRLFEYRLSYLVRSRSFEALPDVVRNRMWRRIDAVLAGDNPDPEFGRIPRIEREAIRRILDR